MVYLKPNNLHLKKEKQELSITLQETQTKIHTLEDIISQRENGIKDAESNTSNLQTKFNEFMENSKITEDKLNQQLMEKDDELHQTQTNLELLQNNTTQEINDLKEQIQSTTLKNDNLSEQIKNLQKELDETQKTVEENKHQYEEISCKLTDSQGSLVDNEEDKKVLFNSLALAMKLVIPNCSQINNVDLYDECVKTKVPMGQWNEWIVSKLTEPK
ncbi:hypothetical protein QTN25_006512 [Entamoeba marina]